MLAIVGNGKFYSSGNDLKSMMSGVSNTPAEILAQRAYDNHISFVDAFIDFPKPIAALVNGPAIGIGKLTVASFLPKNRLEQLDGACFPDFERSPAFDISELFTPKNFRLKKLRRNC